MSVRYLWGKYDRKTIYVKTRYAQGSDGISRSNSEQFMLCSDSDVSFSSSTGNFTVTLTAATSVYSGYECSTYPYAVVVSNDFSVGDSVIVSTVYYTYSSSYYWYRRTTLNLVNSSSRYGSGHSFYSYQGVRDYTKGSFISWVSSSSPSAYPNYDTSGSYFYESETQDVIDPSSVSISGSVFPGSEIQIVVSPSDSALSNSYGTISYQYEYSYDDSGEWKTLGTTTETSYNLTIEAGHSSVKVRVKALDDIGFTSDDYVESISYPISSLADLVISNYDYGEDGNIGTVSKDIEFYISEEGSSVYIVKAYNGQYICEFEATSNVKYYVNVLDLLVGDGKELKFVFGKESGATSEKAFIYTKTAQDFPSENVNVGMLRLEGKDSYPMTIAEAVRTQGGVTLDVYLDTLMSSLNDMASRFSMLSVYRDNLLLSEYEDSNGTNSVTVDVSFTSAQHKILVLYFDFTFTGSNGSGSGSNLNNLMCIGTDPSNYGNGNISMYITGDPTDSVNQILLDIFGSSVGQQHISVGKSLIGHHKLVMKIRFESSGVLNAWLDGTKIVDNVGDKYPTGAFSISNSEGTNRFYGTYHEVSVISNGLTDSELLELSKL